MKLFVFSIKQCRRETLLSAPAVLYQLKVLVGAGGKLWEDEDVSAGAAGTTEQMVRSDYLDPNNIPVIDMGKFPSNSVADFWLHVDNAKLNFGEFYTYEEAVADNVFAADANALCWKTYYVFLSSASGSASVSVSDDIIGNIDYLGTLKEPILYLIDNVVGTVTAAS